MRRRNWICVAADLMHLISILIAQGESVPWKICGLLGVLLNAMFSLERRVGSLAFKSKRFNHLDDARCGGGDDAYDH